MNIVTKYVFMIFLFCLASCENNIEKKRIKKPCEIYKFFDPFVFKGKQEIDSTSLDYPYYKIYSDSLKNIIKIEEYFTNEEMHSYLVKNKGDKHIIYSSHDERYLNV